MFCHNCGKELKDDWNMCPYCNTKVIKKGDSVHDEMPNQQTFHAQKEPDTDNDIRSESSNIQGKKLENFVFIKFLLLSCVTCGIYGIYKLYKFVETVNELCEGDNEKSPNYVVVLLLTMVTFGVYIFYWIYKQARRLENAAPKYNCSLKHTAKGTLLWGTFGSLIAIGPCVSWYRLFSDVNMLVEQYNKGIINDNYVVAQPNKKNSTEIAIIAGFYVVMILIICLISLIPYLLFGSLLEESAEEQTESLQTDMESNDIQLAELSDVDMAEYAFKKIDVLLGDNLGFEENDGLYESLNKTVDIMTDEYGYITYITISGDESTAPSLYGIKLGDDFQQAIKKAKELTKYDKQEVVQELSKAMFYNSKGDILMILCTEEGQRVSDIIYMHDPEMVREYAEDETEEENTSESVTQEAETTINTDSTYIIPDSNSRLLTDDEVRSMDEDTKQMAINEIYARHGRKFNTLEIQEYFNSKTWYTGTVAPENFDESIFNKYERSNISSLSGQPYVGTDNSATSPSIYFAGLYRCELSLNPIQYRELSISVGTDPGLDNCAIGDVVANVEYYYVEYFSDGINKETPDYDYGLITKLENNSYSVVFDSGRTCSMTVDNYGITVSGGELDGYYSLLESYFS